MPAWPAGPSSRKVKIGRLVVVVVTLVICGVLGRHLARLAEGNPEML
jgi:hypothetical protein